MKKLLPSILLLVFSFPGAYFHSPADYRTSTESEAVIGRALCDVGNLVTA